jgi:hypothetical protein
MFGFRFKDHVQKDLERMGEEDERLIVRRKCYSVVQLPSLELMPENVVKEQVRLIKTSLNCQSRFAEKLRSKRAHEKS